MTKKRIIITTMIIVILIAVGAIFATTLTQRAPTRIPIKWGTALPGTYGYTVGSILINFMESQFPEEYDFSLITYPTSTAAEKAVMSREIQVAQTGTPHFKDLYSGKGPYEGYTPPYGKRLVHVAYFYTLEIFLAVPSTEAGKYKSWADLSGKPIFFTKAGWGTWIMARYVWEALGYKFNHIEMDPATVADALKAGTVVATVLYTSSRASLPAWIKELELKVDLTVINPSQEEVAKLKAVGFEVVRIDPKRVFVKDVGVREVIGIPFAYGLSSTTDMSEEFVYRLLKSIEKIKDELPKIEPGLWLIKEDFVGLQATGINS
ncbi:MAG: TAXI family TRAP transporter solute-binding subunit, partial [Nitrososphaerota archaeon]|nr:TAXI family TRAP transporter solute-binding subunit [Nitrososphaerota archaeon]